MARKTRSPSGRKNGESSIAVSEEMRAGEERRLLEIGTADLRKNQAEFERVARQLDPNKSATDVLQELVAVHPTPDKLMQTFGDTFDGLIAFIHTKHIVTLPSDARPTLQETPPFERATTLASMDTPGPFEKVAKEAYFNVTLPGPNDTPEEINDLMKSFNVGTIVPISVHEAFPGHFVQFLLRALCAHETSQSSRSLHQRGRVGALL